MVTRRERAVGKKPKAAEADAGTLQTLKAGLMAAFGSPETPAAALPAIAREIRIIEAALGSGSADQGDMLDELAARRRTTASRRRKTAQG